MSVALILAALFVLAVLGYVSWWVAVPILVLIIGLRIALQIIGLAAVAAIQEQQRQSQTWSIK